MVTSSTDHREPGPSPTTGPARAVLDVGLSPYRALFSVFRDDPQTFDLDDRPFDVALKSLDARSESMAESCCRHDPCEERT